MIKALWAEGSKSEHRAVLIEAEAGRYRLRRIGGNPFMDAVLDDLVGKTVEAEGEMMDDTFFMRVWKILEPCKI